MAELDVAETMMWSATSGCPEVDPDGLGGGVVRGGATHGGGLPPDLDHRRSRQIEGRCARGFSRLHIIIQNRGTFLHKLL